MQDKVLLLSERRISDLVAYCLAYEFEDTVAAVTSARRIDVTDLPSLEFSRRAYKLARSLSGSPELARRFAPAPRGGVTLDRDYELFFPVFSHAFELYSLAAIPNWRQRCRKAACFITEVWSNNLPDYLIELLSGFDHIFLGLRDSVDDIAGITGRPCSYLPLAVDVLRFAPAPDQPRPIELSNIGRRSAVTHQALLEDAERRQSFYYFDTVAASGIDLKQRTFRVDQPQEHRRMLATLLKNSRYFIANRSHVNDPGLGGGGPPTPPPGNDGAAAGAGIGGGAPRAAEL
ncbi:glycosyltransferase family 1 protein, partial [Rhodopseudomonas sp. BAL398]|uniref:glycosyltransferase family 1 protein n=1 Tax=Rhodopseudomonas sp. BAL398 TaxID=3034676 RepID=UPI0023E13A58